VLKHLCLVVAQEAEQLPTKHKALNTAKKINKIKLFPFPTPVVWVGLEWRFCQSNKLPGNTDAEVGLGTTFWTSQVRIKDQSISTSKTPCSFLLLLILSLQQN
jgi:hypothetical protein